MCKDKGLHNKRWKQQVFLETWCIQQYSPLHSRNICRKARIRQHLEHVRDPCIFQEKMRHLKNGKAPGPDGIPNEMLKHLPTGLHQVIHKLFILMWMTGTMPKAWKESQTVLLHKKGSEHDWRPTAIANTLYKLWTGVIAEGLYKYAEHFDILSRAQEGFRKQKNTIRQLQNVMNIMSDAKISQQDLYLLCVDFSSAFNTIDHDKLLCIMHDLRCY